jgi:hypothetical protein
VDTPRRAVSIVRGEEKKFCKDFIQKEYLSQDVAS